MTAWPVAIGRRRVGMNVEKAGKAHGPFPTATTLAERGSRVAVLQAFRDVPRPATRCGDITTVSCTGGTSSPAIPPTSRESNSYAGLRPLEMARPGLEPGTPRFSVVRSESSNQPKTPAKRDAAYEARDAGILGNSLLFFPIRATDGASSPIATGRGPRTQRLTSRPRPRDSSATPVLSATSCSASATASRRRSPG